MGEVRGKRRGIRKKRKVGEEGKRDKEIWVGEWEEGRVEG